VRIGRHSEILWERALLLLKFVENLVVSGPGEAITLQTPWEEMEVHMWHGLARRDTILRDRFTLKYQQKINKENGKGKKGGWRRAGVTASYLTRDGESVSLVYALDDTTNALDSAYELRKLVCAQVCEARGGARRAHEYVCLKKMSENVGKHEQSSSE
jgi:hypothetical protein